MRWVGWRFKFNFSSVEKSVSCAYEVDWAELGGTTKVHVRVEGINVEAEAEAEANAGLGYWISG